MEGARQPSGPGVDAKKRVLLLPWIGRLAIPAVLLAAPAAIAIMTSNASAQGIALYFGREPLVGRIEAPASPLPVQISRCVNCHTQYHGSPVTGGSDAPPLDQRSLLGAESRRGGPPTHFTQESFCSLLREGVDPAHEVISSRMPRYQISDGDCLALWWYVLSQ